MSITKGYVRREITNISIVFGWNVRLIWSYEHSKFSCANIRYMCLKILFFVFLLQITRFEGWELMLLYAHGLMKSFMDWLILSNDNIPQCIWAASTKNVSSSIHRQGKPRSAQSDDGLRCPLTESLDTLERINGVQCPDKNLRIRGMNLTPCIFRMLKDTFSLDAAQIIWVVFSLN